MKDRVYVEVRPFKDRPDAEGFTKGIVHESRECDSIPDNTEGGSINDIVAVYPVFENKFGSYPIKVGRGAWIEVRKDSRCPACFPEENPFGT